MMFDTCSWLDWIRPPTSNDASPHRVDLQAPYKDQSIVRRLRKYKRLLERKDAAHRNLERAHTQVLHRVDELTVASTCLETSNAQYQAQLDDASATSRALTAANAQYQAQLDDASATNRALTAANAQCQAQLDDASATSRALTAANAQCQAQLDDASATNRALTTANAQYQAQLDDASVSRIAFANTVGRWMQAQLPCTRIAPLEGVVTYLVDDASKYTTLLVAYTGPIQTDPTVHAFCDDECTYIMTPRLYENVYQTLRVTCGRTIIELLYQLVPVITHVYTASSTSHDETYVITVRGRNLFTKNSQLRVVGERWSIMLDFADAHSDGTTLSAHVAMPSVDMDGSYTCQLVNALDSSLSSGPMNVTFRSTTLAPES